MKRFGWSFWIDRGGTFTDCLGCDPDGDVHVTKVPSGPTAPLDGIRALMGIEATEPIAPCDVRMGTTVATNALLERSGARVGLLVTRGFGDLLEIGTTARPQLFALDIARAARLYDCVEPINVRADADGKVIAPVDEVDVLQAIERLRGQVDSVVVLVMHGHRAPQLEKQVAALARATGFEDIVLSHEAANQLGMLDRGQTAVVDAYLTPLIAQYLDSLKVQLPGSRLRIMQSSGDLASAERFRGPAAVLSGPAGGVVACSHIAKQSGLGGVIGFDMGGTSTDVCRVQGEPEWRYENQVDGVRICSPMLAIHTVAAGGGSVCRYELGRLVVGPQSVGSVPGPLCYAGSEGTQLSVTDVNYVLGRLVDDRFPLKLDATKAEAALKRMAASSGLTVTEVATGFIEVACEHMASAIGAISVERGYDVRDHCLILFGGAAGQHGCRVARKLGVRSLLVHPYAGVLSAYGMGIADVGWHGQHDLAARPLTPALVAQLDEPCAELERRGRKALEQEGAEPRACRVVERLELRYAGTQSSLTVTRSSDSSELTARFEEAHVRAYGYARPAHPIEAVSLRVAVMGGRAAGHLPSHAPGEGPPQPRSTKSVWFEGGFRDTPVYWREDLLPGHQLDGPAVVTLGTGTLVVEQGFSLSVDDLGQLRLFDESAEPAALQDVSLDPVRLELFCNRFMSIAEQMGHALRRTAMSTNIRERLDFSCAIFDRHGGLVANAPHIPVHLGAMEETVRALRMRYPEPKAAEAYLSNDPSAGGSHLPDLTVVSPVFDEDGEHCFYVASRGHHADVGGITPGSMPPHAHCLEEEGVVFRGVRVLRDGEIDEFAIRQVLESGPFPARDPDQNVADLHAQLAANQRGAGLLRALVGEHGRDVVAAYMRHIQDNAAAKVGDWIESLEDGVYEAVDRLDDGTPLAVTVTVAGRQMHVDFAGTGQSPESNLHAPRAVTVAALIYCVRVMVGRDIPLCSGCLRPVRLAIPSPSLLAPGTEAAVAGGNVETSQRIVDLLLRALGVSAASQGTMNNLTFGSSDYGYYETIGGGAGATRSARGASGVQTHMTNTRITDPEVVESRFAVRLVSFAFRKGSGGDGTHEGGDGLIRCFEALEPLTVSILSDRRSSGAPGLAGGQPGEVGRNWFAGKQVGPRHSGRLEPGQRVTIETPGGGGYGPPDKAT